MNPNGFLTSGKDGLVIQWTREFTPVGQPIRIPSLLNDADSKKCPLKRILFLE